MAEVVIGLGVFTALCLITKPLRIYGFTGVALLSAIFPVAMLVLALVGGAVYLFFRSR